MKASDRSVQTPALQSVVVMHVEPPVQNPPEQMLVRVTTAQSGSEEQRSRHTHATPASDAASTEASAEASG
jgi:hypothetical protein